MNILCSLALGSFEEALDLKIIVPSMGNLFEEEMVKRWEDAWEPALAAPGESYCLRCGPGVLFRDMLEWCHSDPVLLS